MILHKIVGLNNYTVSMSSGEGRINTYSLEKLASGESKHINTAPDGTQTTKQYNQDGSETVDSADGMHTFRQEGPDPRFGMLAPVPEEFKITTPNGLINSLTSSRSAVLADPGDKLSHTSLTETVSLNGKTFTSHYDTASNTWTDTSAENRIATRVLDAKGRLSQSSVADLATVDATYTANGRLASLTEDDGISSRYTEFDYYTTGAQQGYLRSITDAENQTVSFEYDAAGRITKQTLPDAREILTSYDANGNLIAITPPGRPAHNFDYTPMNLGDSDTPPTLAAIANPTTTRSYNLDKQLELITRPDGQTIDFIYGNTTGKLNALSIPRGDYHYSYNATTGKLSQITSPDANTLSFSYDGSLPLSSTWAGDIAGSVSQSYSNDFTIQSRKVNNEAAIQFAYDNDLLLTQAGKLSLTHNTDNGLMTNTELLWGGNSVTTSQSYNGFAEVSSMSASYNATALYSTSYDRDKLGRITYKSDTLNGITTEYDYHYDLAGRLKQIDINGSPSATYSYDANSNRTHINGSAIANYDNQDRLTNYNGATYTYTDNGELQSKTQGGNTTSYDYDVLGNLISVTLPSGTTIDYLIDGQNRRIGKKVNGTLTQGFLYKDQLNPIAELDGNNNLIARFIYGSKFNVPDYMEKGGNTYRILSDHLGSPRLIINLSDGSIAQQIDYDTWGNITLDTHPGFQPFGFAGGIIDQDTQLTRFGARDYDAHTGRWTAKDPIGFAGGDSNLFGYVGVDPINLIDITGLSTCGHYPKGHFLRWICENSPGEEEATECTRKCLRDVLPPNDGLSCPKDTTPPLWDPWYYFGHPYCWTECGWPSGGSS